MVENQQGIISFLSFGAKSVNPEILETLLIGRKKVIDQLESKIKNIVLDGLNHHVIVVGPRGTGKTHMLRVLYHRAQAYIKNDQIRIAYFAEEEYGISGYLDFLVRILKAFIRWNENDSIFLKDQLSLLHETPFIHQERSIEEIIKEYIGQRPLLILVENFNDVLSSLDHSSQSKLRAWLYRNDRISIIATAQALSDDVGKEDAPFFGFFNEIYLKPLSLNESIELLNQLAKLDNREDIIAHLANKGAGQVKAIYQLVKGNHRLLVTFYEFLKADLLSNLSVTFIKTLNDLKPYFETYIRYLPPQQQKIIHFLAMAKIPQNGTEISRQCFIDTKSLSKQLSELSKKRLIDAIPDPADKRNKLYDITEPLLRISVEIGEHRDGISALFIDFLALYYNQDELVDQKYNFVLRLSRSANQSEKINLAYEVDARDKALARKNKEFKNSSEFEKISSLIENGYYLEAQKYLADFVMHNKDSFQAWFLSGEVSYKLKAHSDSVLSYLKALELNSKDAKVWNHLGVAYKNLGKYEDAINCYKKSLDIDHERDGTWFNLGVAYKLIGDNENAITAFQNTLVKNSHDIEAIFNLGKVFIEKKDYRMAESYFHKFIEIEPKASLVWFSLYQIYKNEFELDKAILAYIKYIELNPKIGLLRELSKLSVLRKRGSEISKDKEIRNVNSKIKLGVQSLFEEKLTEFQSYAKGNLVIQYLEVYKRYIFQKDTKAIYELPKEQRKFFLTEILGEETIESF